MTKTSAFCTTAPIGHGHGGGTSSFYELQALIKTTDLRQTFKYKSDFDQHYPNNPFMHDYLSSIAVEKYVDIAFTNGGPWTATIKALKPQKLIVDCPAHDLDLSMEEFKLLCGEYPYKHQYIPEIFKYHSMYIAQADIIVTQSKRSIESLYKLGIQGKRFEVIPGGANLPAGIQPLPDKFTIGYLGAAGPDKGLPYLYLAWQKLALGDNAECVLVGENFIQAYGASLGVYAQNADFRTMGRVENLEEAYSMMSVFVAPSVTEGFNLCVLEAMAHGRPAIVSEGAGVSELIEDGVDGFVVPIRDPDAIAERIMAFYNDHSLIVKMGAAARKKASQYTWLRAEKEYERVING